MSVWVKFHAELTQGAKRGIKRAHRFLYMELSLKARSKRGVVELASGMGDVEGVVDLLGGDAKEIRDALPVLTGGAEPMISFEGEPGARRIVVTAWKKWNAFEEPGASTERSRKSRSMAQQGTHPLPRNDDATEPQRSLHAVGNDEQRSFSIRSDQSRGDQIIPGAPPPLEPPKPSTPPSSGGGIRSEIEQALGKGRQTADLTTTSVLDELEHDAVSRALKTSDVTQAIEWADRRAIAEAAGAGGGQLDETRVVELVLSAFRNAKTVGRNRARAHAPTAGAASSRVHHDPKWDEIEERQRAEHLAKHEAGLEEARLRGKDIPF